MRSVKIGLLKEGKIPADRRVPLTPQQAKQVEKLFPDVTVAVQKSPIRCIDDREYIEEGIEVVDNMMDCDILLGIKEVPVIELMQDKTYLFFSHTIKEQAYNRQLLIEILRKRIRLIDYEILTDKKGNRLIAFGRFAGMIGAYNGIWAYGKRFKLFDIRRAYTCANLEDLRTEFQKVKLPPIKIVLIGNGRAGRGSAEVLFGMGIRQVSPGEFLHEKFSEPVYVQLTSADYNVRNDGAAYDRMDFHTHPENYESDFLKYARISDILISSSYWNPHAPVLFRREDMLDPSFMIKVIADVSCDIKGSIPSTIRPSSVLDPVYDYNPQTGEEEKPYSNENNVTVMAIDNLPNEVPFDASMDFGKQLIEKVFPALFGKDEDGIIERGTITENGQLKEAFEYLEDFVKSDRGQTVTN